MQSLSGKVTSDSLTAAEWNQLPSEVQNVITQAGQTLSAGDLLQLSKAIALYAGSGTFYLDSGVADAYVLSNIGTLITFSSYQRGMQCRFIAAATNTGASTINVAGLGVVAIVKLDGAPLDSGLIVLGQFVELFFDSIGGEFVFIPRASGFDITGLTSALPDLSLDTAPFFDDSAAANRKLLVADIGNRTWEVFSLTVNITINTDNGYRRNYRKTNASNIVITLNDSADAGLINSSFLLVNASDTGNITINRQTAGLFTEGFVASKTQVVLLPGQTKLFLRVANNLYQVSEIRDRLIANRDLFGIQLGGVTGSPNSFTTTNNFQDYTRFWEKITAGDATITYVAQTNSALNGTSFIVYNRAATGTLTVDMSAAIVGPDVILGPGEGFQYYAFSTDSYLGWYINKVPPASIGGYALMGPHVYMNATALNTTTIFPASVSVINTFETYGPTGSLANNIWAAMDDLPTSGVTHVLIKCIFQIQNLNNVSIAQVYLNSAISGALSVDTRICHTGHSVNAGSESKLEAWDIEVPLDSSGFMRLAWERLNEAGAATVIELQLRGFRMKTTA